MAQDKLLIVVWNTNLHLGDHDKRDAAGPESADVATSTDGGKMGLGCQEHKTRLRNGLHFPGAKQPAGGHY